VSERHSFNKTTLTCCILRPARTPVYLVILTQWHTEPPPPVNQFYGSIQHHFEVTPGHSNAVSMIDPIILILTPFWSVRHNIELTFNPSIILTQC